MQILRTRFAQDIVAEVALPKNHKGSAVVICSGMPSTPGKGYYLQWLAARGFMAVFPRYRGTWESSGQFLRESPEKDIRNVVDGLFRGFINVKDHRRLKPSIQRLYLFGASFGGPAAILASRDNRVTKAIALSPVIDWTQEGPEESLASLERFMREGFGEAFRYRKGDWKKLRRGSFYSPWHEKKTVSGKKLMLIHAQDDHVVPWRPTAKFAEATDSRLLLLKRGGHFGSSSVIEPHLWKVVSKFLRT